MREDGPRRSACSVAQRFLNFTPLDLMRRGPDAGLCAEESSRVAADLKPGSFAGALDCPSRSAGLRAESVRELGIRSRLAGPGAGKAAMGKVVRVIVSALAIVAGPGLASLVESPRSPHAQYDRDFQLRGSIALNSDLRLRGSVALNDFQLRGSIR